MDVKKLSFPPLSAENLRAKVRLYTTRVEIDPLTLALYGGTGKGTAWVELAQGARAIAIHFGLDALNLARASAAVSPQNKSHVTGTLDGQVDLQWPLGAADAAQTLTGQGSFAIRDGTFPGLNLGRTLATIAKFLPVGLPDGDTRFSYLGGDLGISGKRLHSQSLKLAAEGLEASLAGSVGFDNTLDYTGEAILRVSVQSASGEESRKKPLRLIGRNLRAAIAKKVEQKLGGIQKVRVRFRVRGTTEDPSFSLAGAPQAIQSQP